MGNPIKQYIQQKLYNRCHEKYLADVERQSNRYAQFLLERGEQVQLDAAECKEKIKANKAAVILPGMSADGADGAHRQNMPPCDFCIVKTKKAFVIYMADGFPDSGACDKIDREFTAKPWLLFVYGHEDFLTEDGRRHSPWCKPVWSPDTLATSFYIGSLFAVQKELYMEWMQKQKAEQNGGDNRLADNSYTALGRTLTSYCIEKTGDILSNQDKKPIDVMDAFLYHRFAAEEAADVWIYPETCFYAGRWKGKATVSVIIPSKDNPQVLRTCISSLHDKTKISADFEIEEIIVVDNGSSRENRARLTTMAEELSFRYCYKPMEFNFSAMCNHGAAMAGGNYLLFLNDDMEIIQEDWLERMMISARQSHVGAVGAKLLYPGTDLIQHAGVTNLRVGPAHKLLKASDTKEYYHGRNRNRHDMLAVTAACLLVAREKFDAAGGFYEGMAVAYNDVDFCFSLYEKGWYNVQCNDVTLYHHESLSRGDDNLSGAKWQRLLQEKQMLYERHPKLWKKDPFYSPLLAGHFSDYICNYEYEYERVEGYTGCKAYRKYPVPQPWHNECLIVNVEHARRWRKLDLSEGKEVYWIEGWSYIIGVDNCRYARSLLLIELSEKGECARDTVKSGGRVYEAEIWNRFREDVEAVLPEQTNVKLAGFSCRIPKEKLKPGHYKIAMLAKDKCSGQRLYRKTDAVLEVEA